ncbi:VOC family protein [Culicoidibacter larvae]|uniref:Glyoxalase/bleomycin resistance/extradiol dioxygenase family protein n=1 Tax=Culicoidibacter larvae TaxID=2579976 RepID=A0A5R8QF59_9FIRM|nr:glyoxalase/bleomycin resistance/extradiol dioxygenase family protein [Culicoidibacter larvae]TLG76628.1 glyoxalase/bleomycin resistance/extradiol dioxygenase family protein [Culicoidibacter larvae]
MKLRPYLTYQGSCEAAIDLYKKAFNAELLTISRFEDLQNAELPDFMQRQILQATLRIGETVIRMCDCFGELNDPESERLSIAVECSTAEVEHAFAVLAEYGRVGIPLQKTGFSPCHGVVFDQFGVMWNFIASE